MTNPNQNPGFILIVDDTPTNIAVLAQALRGALLQVRVATDGESAIEQIALSLPELVLLDVQMPGIDGFETCRRLKANPATQEIPVIFMTALSDTESKVKGLSLGAVDYITKPFEQEEVLARVRVHLQMRYLTKTLQQMTENLEERVAERTRALEQAQLQLVQQEKLATLGQLVAGVAHEINNPMSCIISNIVPAYEYVADFTKVIRLYQQQYPQPIPEITQLLEEIDIEFALKDLCHLLDSMKLSAERIKDISVSLRIFSRSDIKTKIHTNIHDGLDSTLVILGHRLKALGNRSAIEVVKQYGNLPLFVKCYPASLNQVFMNLLANAIDALEEHPSPILRICTEALPNQVVIRIADNGIGMSEEVKQKVFDHSFTTKAVGKGTGLGLSISRQIIEEKHDGRISFVSEVGHGTEFAIFLPVD